MGLFDDKLLQMKHTKSGASVNRDVTKLRTQQKVAGVVFNMEATMLAKMSAAAAAGKPALARKYKDAAEAARRQENPSFLERAKSGFGLFGGVGDGGKSANSSMGVAKKAGKKTTAKKSMKKVKGKQTQTKKLRSMKK